MGIQPIDLQTLYSQLDKVGKSQIQQTLATQQAREAEMAKNREEAEKSIRTVKETETGGEKAGTVREREGSAPDAQTGTDARDRKEDKETQAPERPQEVITDPSLGSIVDISG